MALNPREIPITRDQVYEWLTEYDSDPESRGELREFLDAKVDELGLTDTDINTTEHDSLGDSTSVVDMILLDLDSYTTTKEDDMDRPELGWADDANGNVMPLLIASKQENGTVSGWIFSDTENGFGIDKGDNDYRENLKPGTGDGVYVA